MVTPTSIGCAWLTAGMLHSAAIINATLVLVMWSPSVCQCEVGGRIGSSVPSCAHPARHRAAADIVLVIGRPAPDNAQTGDRAAHDRRPRCDPRRRAAGAARL